VSLNRPATEASEIKKNKTKIKRHLPDNPLCSTTRVCGLLLVPLPVCAMVDVFC
jgi:hypothetical protein